MSTDFGVVGAISDLCQSVVICVICVRKKIDSIRATGCLFHDASSLHPPSFIRHCSSGTEKRNKGRSFMMIDFFGLPVH